MRNTFNTGSRPIKDAVYAGIAVQYVACTLCMYT